MGMISEFKEFAIKGNMVDMAVGIVLGAAFGTIMTSLVGDILTPLVSWAAGLPDFSNMFVELSPAAKAPADQSFNAFKDAEGVGLGFGNFINAFISFLLVALALFFVVKGINNVKKAEAEAPPEPTASEVLLGEIRDALKK